MATLLKEYAAKSTRGQLGSSEMLCFTRQCLNTCAIPAFSNITSEKMPANCSYLHFGKEEGERDTYLHSYETQVKLNACKSQEITTLRKTKREAVHLADAQQTFASSCL